jgi:hypothetical protein
MAQIAIFSLRNDLHAYAVLRELNQRPQVDAHFVATDDMLTGGRIRWWQGSDADNAISTFDGAMIGVSDLDAIWWRRVNQPQLGSEAIPDEVTRELVNNEWKAALLGFVFDGFKGTWINDPAKDAIAGNKLYQLNAAARVGLRIPRTLISQDPEVVRSFCHDLGGQVIVKKLVGTALRPLATLLLSMDELQDDDALAACPSIYQERIVGRRHLRVNCFGDRAHAFLIETDVLDWRRDLSVPVSRYDLDSATEAQLLRLLRQLGLKMGVMDMMLEEPSGAPVWIELNTQGQFLFGEALTGADLTGSFADFLVRAAASR